MTLEVNKVAVITRIATPTEEMVYPAGIPESALDATYLEVAEDDSTTYFRAEFVALPDADSSGALPTFAALAVSTTDGGTNRVGRNARYDYPRGEGPIIHNPVQEDHVFVAVANANQQIDRQQQG